MKLPLTILFVLLSVVVCLGQKEEEEMMRKRSRDAYLFPNRGGRNNRRARVRGAGAEEDPFRFLQASMSMPSKSPKGRKTF